MPHAVEIATELRTQQSKSGTPKSKTISKLSSKPSREIKYLHNLLSESRDRYQKSPLAVSISRLLSTKSKSKRPLTKVLSLGLGTLVKSSEQGRRMKQLVILLAIASHLQQSEPKLEIYAQDPGFSKTDEAFLVSLGIQISRTTSASELGEAAYHVTASTLIYSPFLTLEAYALLFNPKSGTERPQLMVGDDFDALRTKWPKHEGGWDEAEGLSRQIHALGLRKKTMGIDVEFWDVVDKAFPMAVYSAGEVEGRIGKKFERGNVKAML